MSSISIVATDLIFNVYNPLSAGATDTGAAESVTTMNLGTISNHGVELSADMDVYKTKDWTVNVGASITFREEQGGEVAWKQEPRWHYRRQSEDCKRVRIAISSLPTLGRYSTPKNGLSLYKFNDDDYFFTDGGTTYGNPAGTQITGSQLNAVVVIDGKAYTYLTTYGKREFHGSAMPTAYGSFNVSASYKAFSLYTLFTYQLGGKVMDNNYQRLICSLAKHAYSPAQGRAEGMDCRSGYCHRCDRS